MSTRAARLRLLGLVLSVAIASALAWVVIGGDLDTGYRSDVTSRNLDLELIWITSVLARGSASSDLVSVTRRDGLAAAALAPLGFYLAMALKTWRLYASSGNLTQGLASFGVIVVLVNGFFQEEALFAPPALGLLCCLAGLVIGNHIRTQSTSARAG